MSGEWFTAAELAGAALPGLQRTRRGVNRQATRNKWTSRPRKGRGGGAEYHISSLPIEARLELTRRASSSLRQQSGIPLPVAVGAAQPGTAKRATRVVLGDARRTRADARLAVLSLFDDFHRAAHTGRRRAETAFAA